MRNSSFFRLLIYWRDETSKQSAREEKEKRREEKEKEKEKEKEGNGVLGTSSSSSSFIIHTRRATKP